MSHIQKKIYDGSLSISSFFSKVCLLSFAQISSKSKNINLEFFIQLIIFFPYNNLKNPFMEAGTLLTYFTKVNPDQANQIQKQNLFLDQMVYIIQLNGKHKLKLFETSVYLQYTNINLKQTYILSLTSDLSFNCVTTQADNHNSQILSFRFRKGENHICQFKGLSKQKNVHMQQILKLRLVQSSQLLSLYDITRKIYQSSSSTVFLVKRKCDKKKFILKVLPKVSYDDAKQASVIQNELNILRQMNSKYIVHFQSAYISQNNLYIAQQYLPGNTLFEVIFSPLYHLTAEKITQIMRRILKGVKYIHSLKIVHRDLKPSNIMITDKNLTKPVLVDFGLALKCDKSNYSKSLGTPGYIAPQNLKHQKYQNSAILISDMFSVGVIFYNLITKQNFFGENLSRTEIILRNKNYKNQYLEEKLSNQNINGKTADLLKKMLEQDPKKRISVVQALQHPFFSPTDTSSALKQ